MAIFAEATAGSQAACELYSLAKRKERNQLPRLHLLITSRTDHPAHLAPPSLTSLCNL